MNGGGNVLSVRIASQKLIGNPVFGIMKGTGLV